MLRDEERFDSLTKYITAGEDSEIYRAIELIFDPDSAFWYSDPMTIEEASIGKRYTSRYFPDSKHINVFTKLFSEWMLRHFSCNTEGQSIEVGGLQLPNPKRQLFLVGMMCRIGVAFVMATSTATT